MTAAPPHSDRTIRCVVALWHRMAGEALADALTLRGIDTRTCIAELPDVVRTCRDHAAAVLVFPALSGRAPRGSRPISVPSALQSVDAQIVVLLPHASAQESQALIGEGAAACVTFDDGVDTLANAIRTVVIAPPSAARPAASPDPFEQLTARDRQILLLVAEGCTNAESAERIGVSVRTVENTRAAIGRTLGIRGRNAFFEYALERGLIR